MDGKKAVFLTAAASAAEFLGYYVSGSAALLSDAIFMAVGMVTLSIIVYGIRSKKTLAFASAIGLFAVLSGFYLVLFSYRRFVAGNAVEPVSMLIFALSGIVFASLATRKSRGIYRREKMNPFVHVLRKTVPSLMVLSASLWILFTGEFLADYLSGAIIGFFVIFESLLLFRDSACLLLGVKKSETCLFKN